MSLFKIYTTQYSGLTFYVFPEGCSTRLIVESSPEDPKPYEEIVKVMLLDEDLDLVVLRAGALMRPHLGKPSSDARETGLDVLRQAVWEVAQRRSH